MKTLLRSIAWFTLLAALVLPACGGGGGGGGGGGVKAPAYTVTYNGNGNTGGSVPEDTTNYEQGATVTVLGNTGNLIKDGYFFAGWCVAENGEGTTYTQGQPFVMGTANVTLYARWFPYSTGILDIDFGEGGIVTTPLGEDTQDEARALAIQADGKIVVAGSSFGDFALVRYDENGDPDSTFGIGGKVVTSIGEGTSDEAFALAIQADGKIVVAGSSRDGANTNFALVRYDENGEPDPTFGADGIATVDIETEDIAYALAIQADGKIVAAGYSFDGANADFALVRCDENGEPDPTFGTAGILTVDIEIEDTARALAIQADGKIVAAGYSFDGANADFALVRCDENGEPDPTFGADGIVTVDIETEDIAYALAIQADGKIVAAGYSFDGANADFALVRCDENGEPDQTFGTDGIVTVDIDTDDRAYALAIQDDGKIVAAGYSFDGANTDFALVRCDENGEPDQTFDTDGIVITQVASPVVLMRFDEARALAIQADGKIIAAGKSYNSTDDDFALVRYE